MSEITWEQLSTDERAMLRAAMRTSLTFPTASSEYATAQGLFQKGLIDPDRSDIRYWTYVIREEGRRLVETNPESPAAEDVADVSLDDLIKALESGTPDERKHMVWGYTARLRGDKAYLEGELATTKQRLATAEEAFEDMVAWERYYDSSPDAKRAISSFVNRAKSELAAIRGEETEP